MSDDIDNVWICDNVFEDYKTKGIDSANPLLILTKRVLELFDRYGGICSFKTVMEDLNVNRSQLYDIFQVLVGAGIIENIYLSKKSYFKFKSITFARQPSALSKVHKGVQTEDDSSTTHKTHETATTASNGANNKIDAGSSMRAHRTKQYSNIGSATTIDAKSFGVSMKACDNMIEVMSDGSIQLRKETVPKSATENVQLSAPSTNNMETTAVLASAYVMLPSEGSLTFPTYFKAIPMPANFMASQALRISQAETPLNSVAKNISKTNEIDYISNSPIASDKQKITYTGYNDKVLSFLPIPQLPVPSSVILNQKTDVRTTPMQVQKLNFQPLTMPTFTSEPNTSKTSVVKSNSAAKVAAPPSTWTAFSDEITEQKQGKSDVWDYESLSDDESEETLQTDDTDSSGKEADDIYQHGNTKILSQIFFKRTDPEITMDFLEMFKSRPVLHCSSGMPDNIYDKAITQIKMKLNEKWGLCYTDDSISKSVKRIRDWYYMVSYKRSKMEVPEDCVYRHRRYFDKLAEFLPENGLGIPCDQCHRRMFNATSLQVHKARVHNHRPLPFKCKTCHLRFSTSIMQTEHEKLHAPKFKCETCNKHFISRSLLYAHLNTHSKTTVDPSCVCDVCGRKFARPNYCTSHKRIHSQPQYKCEICGKTYFRVTLLNYHMKTHRNQKDFVCEICGAAFYRKDSMQEHQIGKHQSGYICNICNLSFSTNICLKNHQRRYHFVYEGTIEDLEKITSTGYKRYCVYEEETKKKIYVCDICGNSYYAVSGYHLHRVKVHGIKPVPHPIRSKYASKKVSNASKTDDDLKHN